MKDKSYQLTPVRMQAASEAQPNHYLMVQRTGRYGKADPTKPIGPHGLRSWWYRRLAAAGIVPDGTTKGERMHKARHTAGQRVLDATGNLKAVQKLLATSRFRQRATSMPTGTSISSPLRWLRSLTTTVRRTMSLLRNRSVELQKNPANEGFIPPTGFEPVLPP
jgi:hypothetical protein